MKGLFGRALELNCLFLVVVALLVALQLVLQRSHHKELLVQLRERGDEGAGGEEPQQALPQLDPPSHPAKDNLQRDDAKAVWSGGGGSGGATGGDGMIAAPVVPNIRRSFPKRKAPYVRKAKKNKKKKKNRKSKQQQKMELMREGGGGGGEGSEGGGGRGINKGDVGGSVKATPKAGRRGKGKGNDKTKVKG